MVVRNSCPGIPSYHQSIRNSPWFTISAETSHPGIIPQFRSRVTDATKTDTAQTDSLILTYCCVTHANTSLNALVSMRQDSEPKDYLSS
mmetsp:Transcript_133942/g.232488  ORF Transcript_133942/g.232488 Transcript_133942/m.232488 type:complete len:89 (-) Transcript_133942:1141-1407(-)